ncbi:hypothetical protein ACLI4Y_07585 [Natrialbaceae archaeon A-CW3]
MPLDHHPIPHEALPPGWGPAVVGEDELVYRRRQPPVELIAQDGHAEQAHPSLGIGRCWKLQYRHQIGELSVTETIGHVSTREGAITGLLECMTHLHEHLGQRADPIEIQSAIDDLSLPASLPEGRDMPGDRLR